MRPSVGDPQRMSLEVPERFAALLNRHDDVERGYLVAGDLFY